MIQANEIRINNKLILLGEIVTVKGISNTPERADMYWIETDGIIATKIIHFKPIPLTEELLLKCGFEYKNPFGYRMKQGCYLRGDLEYSGYFFRWNGQTLAGIHYLHQLQNLYFALTGQELKIN